jgi:hypothetical protein
LEAIGSQAYRLDLQGKLKVHNVFHVSLLKPYKGSDESPVVPVDYDDDGGAYWAVEAILSHKLVPKSKRNYQYLVRWRGFGPEHDSWITAKQFSEDSMIKEYWAAVPKK